MAENITQSQFADKIEVVRASVSHVLSGRNNPSYEFIKAIMAHYPSLNMEWLMFGKGKMYKDGAETALQVPQPRVGSHEEQTPVPHEDLLFNDLYSEDQTDEINPDVTPASQSSPADATVPISLLKTLTESTQNIAKQRKVSKIIVMFDDGTYQEM